MRPVSVLVVEDDPAVLELIGAVLRALAGHGMEVRTATDAAEALALAQATPPDLVVTDLVLPGTMDGLGLVRALRADPRLQATRALVVTAQVRPGMEAEVAAAGADAYLPKPFRARALIDEVTALLGA